jgi:hypothetical protein
MGWEFARTGYDLKAALRLIATSRAYQAQAVQRKKEDSEGGFVFRGPRAKRMTAEQFMDAVWQMTETAPKSWDAPVRRGMPREDLVATNPWKATWIGASGAGEVGALDGSTDAKKRVRVIRKLLDLPSKPQKAVCVFASLRDVRLFVNGAELKAPHVRRHGHVSELSLESVLAAGENSVVLVFPEAGEKAGICMGIELSFKDGAARSVFSGEDWEWSGSFNEDMLKGGKLAVKAPEFKQARWLPVETVSNPTAEDVSSAKLQRDYVWALQPQPLARASVVKADLLMRTLGRPNRDQIVTSRPQELSTLEALDLSAGARLSEILKAGTGKILQKKAGSPGELVDWLYDFSLCRRASSEEKAAALEALGPKPSAESLEDLLWAIVVSPEFQLVR